MACQYNDNEPNGGLLPGSIYVMEFNRYFHTWYHPDTGKAHLVHYWIKQNDFDFVILGGGMAIEIILN